MCFVRVFGKRLGNRVKHRSRRKQRPVFGYDEDLLMNALDHLCFLAL